MSKIRRCSICKLRKLDKNIDEMIKKRCKQVEILNYINKTHQSFLKKEGKSKGLNKSQLSICLNKHVDIEEIKNNENLKDEELRRLKEEIDKEILEGRILDELLKGELLLTKNIQNILNQQIQNNSLDKDLITLYKHTAKQVQEIYFNKVRIEKDLLSDVNVDIELSLEDIQRTALDYLEHKEDFKNIEEYFIQNKYELEEYKNEG